MVERSKRRKRSLLKAYNVWVNVMHQVMSQKGEISRKEVAKILKEQDAWEDVKCDFRSAYGKDWWTRDDWIDDMLDQLPD